MRYFRTYASAAAKAAKLGLIGHSAAGRVLNDVEASMGANAADCAPGSANERLLLDELAEARASLSSGSGGMLSFAFRFSQTLRDPLALRMPLRRLREALDGTLGGGR